MMLRSDKLILRITPGQYYLTAVDTSVIHVLSNKCQGVLANPPLRLYMPTLLHTIHKSAHHFLPAAIVCGVVEVCSLLPLPVVDD
jgi:hypothetical protein